MPQETWTSISQGKQALSISEFACFVPVRVVCAFLLAAVVACSGSSENDAPGSGSSARDGMSEELASLTRPTRLAWGPDGRLYVATLFGDVRAYRFDDAWDVVETSVYTGLSNETENEILGLAFNPHDGDSPVRLYVAHANINSGSCGDPFFPYSGRISKLSGPDFDAPEPIVTGLPASPGTHGVNGLAFDDFGDLYVSVGGVTNAGVASCDIGGMPETPLSGAVVKVSVSTLSGAANIVYRQRADDTLDDNQVNGATVDLDPESKVSLFATGLRNAFTVHFASNALLYALDNGPDTGGGDASTSATTQSPIEAASDTLELIVDGGYYGHPNRNRGRDDAQQNVYISSDAAMPGPGVEKPLFALPASTNGLAELRSNAWGSDHRGRLIAQRWNQETISIELAPDGRTVVESEDLAIEFPALDIVMGPGGALIGADFSGNAVRLMRAERIPGIDDLPRNQIAAFDVHPWRAPAVGGSAFVIAGQGLDRGADSPEVRFGETVAVVTRVRANRIEGILPVLTPGIARKPGDVGGSLVDVTVEIDGLTSTILGAFLPLPEIAP
jgi:glucose/arabinose dehydrogenase